jgi:hypothetical protein
VRRDTSAAATRAGGAICGTSSSAAPAPRHAACTTVSAGRMSSLELRAHSRARFSFRLCEVAGEPSPSLCPPLVACACAVAPAELIEALVSRLTATASAADPIATLRVARELAASGRGAHATSLLRVLEGMCSSVPPSSAHLTLHAMVLAASGDAASLHAAAAAFRRTKDRRGSFGWHAAACAALAACADAVDGVLSSLEVSGPQEWRGSSCAITDRRTPLRRAARRRLLVRLRARQHMRPTVLRPVQRCAWAWM